MTFTNTVIPPCSSFFPMTLIVVYLVVLVFSWINYGIYFRLHVGLYGKDLVNAYLSFCVIGTVVCLFVSSVLWVAASRYIVKTSQRIRYTVVGVAVLFFLKDLPLFVLESLALRRHGWRNGYQGFCFIAQLCFFLLALVVTWLAFIWFITTCIESYCGNSDAHPRTTLADVMAAPPPLMLQETSHRRDEDPGFLVYVNDSRESLSSYDHNHSEIPQNYRKPARGYI